MCFEDVIEVVESGGVVADIAHAGAGRSNQRLLVVTLQGYIHAVPYVKGGGKMFLKTIFPSRALQRIYGG